MFSGRYPGCFDRAGQLRDFGFAHAGIDFPEHLDALFGPVRIDDEPARALRQREAHECVDDGRNRFDAEHPAPADSDVAEIADDVVRQIGDEDAEDDVELEKSAELAAVLRRGDLRDEERRRDRRNADADPADEARDDERTHIPGESGADRRHHVQNTVENQDFPAPPPFGRDSAEAGAEHGAPQRRTQRPAVHRAAQGPEVLNLFFGPRNHHRVEAEQETGQGRCDGPEQ